MPKGMQRSSVIKVSITPDLYEKLKVLASRQGQTAASLAAIAVGQYVSTQYAPIAMQERLAEETLKLLRSLPAQMELMVGEGKS
jgi:predicted DNA-binding protein